MKIEVPFELGDYVIVIEEVDDHYGVYYTMKVTKFSYDLIKAYMDNRVFSDCASAQKRLEELNGN